MSKNKKYKQNWYGILLFAKWEYYEDDEDNLSVVEQVRANDDEPQPEYRPSSRFINSFDAYLQANTLLQWRESR